MIGNIILGKKNKDSKQKMLPPTPSFKQQHLQHWLNKYCRVSHANKKLESIN